MAPRAVMVFCVALAAAAVLVVFANLASSDIATPSRLTPFVGDARSLVRPIAGPTGWWPLPLRLAQVGCSADGQTAVFAFDAVGSGTPTYAVIGLGGLGVPPSAPTVIRALPSAEFDASPLDLPGMLGHGCA